MSEKHKYGKPEDLRVLRALLRYACQYLWTWVCVIVHLIQISSILPVEF